MKVRFHLALLLISLLASCDKKGDTGKSESAGASNPAITRAKRPPREEVPNRYQELRDSLKAALALESPAARDQALAAVVRNTHILAPEIAAEAFAHLAVDSATRMKTIRYLAAQLAGKNPDEALVWADSLGSAQEILTAKEEIAVVLVRSDPARATKILLESGSASREFDATAKQVIRIWVATAPKDAVAWGLSLPPGETRRAGFQAVVSQWLHADMRAAFAWLASLDNQAVKDESMHAMAQTLVEQPEPIRELYLANGDPATMSELKQQVNQITGKAKDESPQTPSERAQDQ
ncbi:MAG: hypothetical protein NTV46_15975 [Verrucomicrobia bacterium]|nr:hypothetical protein [Verrucomicrobiota bacterium]